MTTETNSYATDGRCHNAQPGTYGHECGKPAVWLGTNAKPFTMGFCDNCKRHGYEARDVVKWERIKATPSSVDGRAYGGDPMEWEPGCGY